MKVLVTGSEGFIGRNLCEALISAGHEVTALDKRMGDPSVLPDGSIKIVGDIKYYNIADYCCKDKDWIIHLAANTGVISSIDNPYEDMEVNVKGTVNILEAAKNNGVRKVILASSGAVYGNNLEPPYSEDQVGAPSSPYGASKLSTEAYASAYTHSLGLETIALRFSNVYGRYSDKKTSVIPKFIKHVLTTNELFYIYGDGSATRDFIHVDDIVRGIILACTTKVSGHKVFNLGTGVQTPIAHVLEYMDRKLLELSSRSCIIRSAPEKAGEIKSSYLDVSKAHTVLGFTPKVTLEDGLVDTIKWFVLEQENNK
jgi:UDP-glucose 4-epimerase